MVKKAGRMGNKPDRGLFAKRARGLLTQSVHIYIFGYDLVKFKT